MPFSTYIWCCALAAIWLFPTTSVVHAATLLRGESRTCRDYADLDFALDHPTSDYFKGWTSTDFDAAQQWVTACTDSPPGKQDQIRRSLLAQRRQTLEASGETSRNEQAHAATRQADIEDQQATEAAALAADAARNAAEAKAAADVASAQVKADAIARQETARRAAFVECTRSPAYQRYMAETMVLEALVRESAAHQRLDREKRVEDASGVTDLAAKHDAAEALVNAEDDEHRWWTVYRKNGGDASAPQGLQRSNGKPCES